VVILVGLNTTRTTAGLFTFVILLSASSILFLYLFGLLAAMKAKPSRAASVAFIAGLTFLAFAFYGSGFEADAWSVVLLGLGIVVRSIMRRLNSRAVLAVA
jgi:APA family basic amino acid/polyamine antiporter